MANEIALSFEIPPRILTNKSSIENRQSTILKPSSFKKVRASVTVAARTVFLFWLALAFLGCNQQPAFGADHNEQAIILKAAHRNGLTQVQIAILFAIRKSENGRPGREFGVLHPRAIDTDLDTQAGWAAATVKKNWQRWLIVDTEVSFVEFLADRYCPPAADPQGNQNWKRNVQFWALKILQAPSVSAGTVQGDQ